MDELKPIFPKVEAKYDTKKIKIDVDEYFEAVNTDIKEELLDDEIKEENHIGKVDADIKSEFSLNGEYFEADVKDEE